MDLVFRKIVRGANLQPERGEIILCPADPAQQQRRDLALLVFERGLDVLVRGDGPPSRLVLDCDPTLDDMLAAVWIARLAEGQALPAGGKAFSRYTALVREGLRPTEFPLENSLEGIYLALRNTSRGDLTEPEASRRFKEDWSRLAEHILKQATEGVDPFQTPFTGGGDFARERSFLVRDHEVFDQDVKCGERWQVTIPGRPAPARALLLHKPRSLLFKYWTRQPQDRAKEPYLLLAVQWEPGQWVFSTDPVFRVSLKPLADLLQDAEKKKDAVRADTDPWFDGKPFAHTLVASPRAGSRLDDRETLRLLRHWAQARPLDRRAFPARKLALAATLLLTVVGIVFWQFPRSGDPLRKRGLDVADDPAVTQATPGTLHILAVGVSRYQDQQFNLTYAHTDAEKLVQAFAAQSDGLFTQVQPKLLTNEKATRESILKELRLLKDRVTQHDLVVVTVAGHGANLDLHDDFYFMPHDYEDAKKESTGVYWDDFKRFLGKMPCYVFLVMDTCHSGTITKSLRGSPAGLERGIKKNFGTPEGKGLVVMAACLGSGTAAESQDWGHGVLTLALLEGLGGRHLYKAKSKTQMPPGHGDQKIISLQDLDYYVSQRVTELVGGQAVVTNHTGDLAPQRIFLAKH